MLGLDVARGMARPDPRRSQDHASPGRCRTGWPLTAGAIPLVGFGTWQLRGEECYAATLAALEAGYRHLDTATMYRNEAEVGRAIAESGVARDEVFVTTKYNPRSGGDERAILEQSLEALGTDHVDLWLVHAPADDNVRVWESFVAAQSDGQARDIGVSNFSLGQVDRVREATGVLPAVNQIEWRPSLYDARVADGHASRGVVLEGYSALKGGSLRDPVVTPGRRRGRPDPRPGTGPLARPARLRRHPALLEGRPGAVQRRRRRVRALRRPDGRPRRSGPRLTRWTR